MLPLTEAAVRLGITYDAARRRLNRGTLHGEKRGDRWFVAVPTPNIRPDPDPDESERGPDATGSPPDALVAVLQDEITFLRAELVARTEENRRKDHLLAAALERLPALPETVDAQNRSQDVNPAPQRDDTHGMADLTLHQARDVPQPAGESVGRRWWRKFVGG